MNQSNTETKKSRIKDVIQNWSKQDQHAYEDAAVQLSLFEPGRIVDLSWYINERVRTKLVAAGFIKEFETNDGSSNKTAKVQVTDRMTAMEDPEYPAYVEEWTCYSTRAYNTVKTLLTHTSLKTISFRIVEKDLESIFPVSARLQEEGHEVHIIDTYTRFLKRRRLTYEVIRGNKNED